MCGNYGQEQRDIHATETFNYLSLLTAIRASGAKRPEVTLESYLNFWLWERKALYSIEAAANELAVMVSFENDRGLMVNHQIDPTNEEAGTTWRDQIVKHVQERIRTPMAVQPPMCMNEVLTELQTSFPGKNWEGEDADLQQGLLIAEAMRLEAKGNMHCIYAKTVSMGFQTYTGFQYYVADLFKYQGKGIYARWCVERRCWTTEDGP